jgi:adenosylhomocysteine nucleosidase
MPPLCRSPLMESAHSVLAVTCLAFEARLAIGPGVRVVCGTEGRRLRAQLEAATASGDCCGIISFGVAGGLDPDLAPGDWIVAASVVSDTGRFRADESWARALLAALPGAMQADIAGVDAPVADTAAKRLLHRSHGAAVVDTESHIAATIAARRGLPFAAARVVLDPASRRLPPAALVPLRHNGTADVGAVLRSVWRTPSQTADLLRIVADASIAWGSLARGRRRLGEQFGFPSHVVLHGGQRAVAEPALLVQSAAGSR